MALRGGARAVPCRFGGRAEHRSGADSSRKNKSDYIYPPRGGRLVARRAALRVSTTRAGDRLGIGAFSWSGVGGCLAEVGRVRQTWGDESRCGRSRATTLAAARVAAFWSNTCAQAHSRQRGNAERMALACQHDVVVLQWLFSALRAMFASGAAEASCASRGAARAHATSEWRNTLGA